MKITCLHLPTNHLASTRQFYADRLRLPVRQTTPHSLTVRVGWTDLVFTQTNKPLTPYHFAFNIPLHGLEQYLRWFNLPYLDLIGTDKIVKFDPWKARAAYFYDPNGNLVEFIERQDADFSRFGSFFQGISEIGIPTDDVAASTDWLSSELGLNSFSKSQPQPNFNAVGDDHGLFILAQLGRRWLFTNIVAAETGLYNSLYGSIRTSTRDHGSSNTTASVPIVFAAPRSVPALVGVPPLPTAKAASREAPHGLQSGRFSG